MAFMRCFLLLFCLLFLHKPFVSSQSVIVNCVPSGDETFLCDDRADICSDLGFETTFEKTCEDDETLFYDPQYPCNCNTVCVKDLALGEECFISYSSSYPEEMCGNGLDCLWDSDPDVQNFVCSRNPAKPCVNMTIQYEAEQAAGTLGPNKLYPLCDNVGKFAPKQCSTSTTCYCTDVDGNRLFGEAPYTEMDQMDCECSRFWVRNTQLGIEEGLRCLHNGNIDPLQCNKDFCFCYDSETAKITQGPVDPLVITQLDCYNSSYHKVDYTNPCHAALALYIQQNPEQDQGLVIGPSLKPNCGLDGLYDSIQPTSAGYMCTDVHGIMIENFHFLSSELDNSNCNCATRRSIMRNAGLLETLPECCPNGNFKPLQVRGLFAFCVDDNGNQDGIALPMTDIDSLPCNETC